MGGMGGMGGMPGMGGMFGGGAGAGAGAAGQATSPPTEPFPNLFAPNAGNTAGGAAGAIAPGAGAGAGAAANPFASLFGPGGAGGFGGFGGAGAGAGAGGAGAGAGGNPFGGFNPAMFGNMGGLGGFGGYGGGAPPPPADTRPPEEIYATQLGQLNAMVSAATCHCPPKTASPKTLGRCFLFPCTRRPSGMMPRPSPSRRPRSPCGPSLAIQIGTPCPYHTMPSRRSTEEGLKLTIRECGTPRRTSEH
jgi:hypothetical protein